jgi:integrase
MATSIQTFNPPFETDLSADLRESVTDFLRESRAPNTHRAYRAALTAFFAFSEASGRAAIPASAQAVAAYLAHQAREGRRCSTVSLHAAAIRYAHRVAGHPNPCDSALVREVVRGIRRTTGVAPKQAAALTLPRLAQAILRLDRSSVRGRRDTALLNLGFALAARRSELVALNVDDLEDDGDGLLVRVRRSKTDQEGQGSVLYVPMARELLDVCAVRAVRDWIGDLAESHGPLFRSVRKGGALGGRLSDRAVDLVVRSVTGGVGGPVAFSAHSLRSGLVTTLAAQGRTELEIMEQSRHKSSAMVRSYSRTLDAKRASPLHGAW